MNVEVQVSRTDVRWNLAAPDWRENVRCMRTCGRSIVVAWTGRFIASLRLHALVCLTASPLSVAPSWAQAASDAHTAPSATTTADYRITAGDQLAIKFFYAPELNESVMVRPDGKISLALIGEVRADDSTPAGLARRLSQAYATKLRHPNLAVEVERGFGMQQVFVGGEVVKPGAQPLGPSLTLMRALIVAEGTKDSAAPNRVLIFRRGADGASEVIRVDMSKHMRGRSGMDPVLRPYDVVLVPPSRVSRLNKWIDLYIRRNLPVSFSYDLNPYDRID